MHTAQSVTSKETTAPATTTLPRPHKRKSTRRTRKSTSGKTKETRKRKSSTSLIIDNKDIPSQSIKRLKCASLDEATVPETSGSKFAENALSTLVCIDSDNGGDNSYDESGIALSSKFDEPTITKMDFDESREIQDLEVKNTCQSIPELSVVSQTEQTSTLIETNEEKEINNDPRLKYFLKTEGIKVTVPPSLFQTVDLHQHPRLTSYVEFRFPYEPIVYYVILFLCRSFLLIRISEESCEKQRLGNTTPSKKWCIIDMNQHGIEDIVDILLETDIIIASLIRPWTDVNVSVQVPSQETNNSHKLMIYVRSFQHQSPSSPLSSSPLSMYEITRSYHSRKMKKWQLSKAYMWMVRSLSVRLGTIVLSQNALKFLYFMLVKLRYNNFDSIATKTGQYHFWKLIVEFSIRIVLLPLGFIAVSNVDFIKGSLISDSVKNNDKSITLKYVRSKKISLYINLLPYLTSSNSNVDNSSLLQYKPHYYYIKYNNEVDGEANKKDQKHQQSTRENEAIDLSNYGHIHSNKHGNSLPLIYTSPYGISRNNNQNGHSNSTTVRIEHNESRCVYEQKLMDCITITIDINCISGVVARLIRIEKFETNDNHFSKSSHLAARLRDQYHESWNWRNDTKHALINPLRFWMKYHPQVILMLSVLELEGKPIKDYHKSLARFCWEHTTGFSATESYNQKNDFLSRSNESHDILTLSNSEYAYNGTDEFYLSCIKNDVFELVNKVDLDAGYNSDDLVHLFDPTARWECSPEELLYRSLAYALLKTLLCSHHHGKYEWKLTNKALYYAECCRHAKLSPHTLPMPSWLKEKASIPTVDPRHIERSQMVLGEWKIYTGCGQPVELTMQHKIDHDEYTILTSNEFGQDFPFLLQNMPKSNRKYVLHNSYSIGTDFSELHPNSNQRLDWRQYKHFFKSSDNIYVGNNNWLSELLNVFCSQFVDDKAISKTLNTLRLPFTQLDDKINSCSGNIWNINNDGDDDGDSDVDLYFDSDMREKEEMLWVKMCRFSTVSSPSQIETIRNEILSNLHKYLKKKTKYCHLPRVIIPIALSILLPLSYIGDIMAVGNIHSMNEFAKNLIEIPMSTSPIIIQACLHVISFNLSDYFICKWSPNIPQTRLAIHNQHYLRRITPSEQVYLLAVDHPKMGQFYWIVHIRWFYHSGSNANDYASPQGTIISLLFSTEQQHEISFTPDAVADNLKYYPKDVNEGTFEHMLHYTTFFAWPSQFE